MNPDDYLILAVAVCAATALQGSIGFGAGLVAAPVIALVAPELLPALAGRIPGSLLGAWLAVAMSTAALSWLVAACVLAGVGSAFLGWRPVPNRTNLVAAGGLSGVMGTATAIGGAPMAIVWQGQPPARLRGTMSAFFLVGSVVSVSLLAAAGAVTSGTVAAFLWLAPVVLVGFVLSRWLNRFLDARRLRLVALIASTGGAVLLIIRLISDG
ncbi:MAG: sulfite exporter TauE/SafE family protein [Actinomycetota bacterium]